MSDKKIKFENMLFALSKHKKTVYHCLLYDIGLCDIFWNIVTKIEH